MIIRLLFFCYVSQRILGWDLSSPAYFAAYGNIASIEDLFLPDLTQTDDFNADKEPDPIKHEEDYRKVVDDSVEIETIEEIFNIKGEPPRDMTLDEKHLHELDTEVYKISRRQTEWCKSKRHCTEYDPVQFKFATAPKTENEYIGEEKRKIGVLKDICLGFLIHTRREVQKAFDQREKVRHDKRYKIGYLFNRVRRLRVEMAKIINSVIRFYSGARPINDNGSEEETEGRISNMTLLIRAYEEVSRFDVDIKDTLNIIKDIYAIPEHYDLEKK